MNKQEFLSALKDALSGLPQEDIDERVSFYGEMIEDCMEEGANEGEAIERIGNVDEIVSQTVAEISLTKLVKERVKPKRALRVWEIVLIVLGAPVWLPLLIAVIAVFFGIYIAVWSCIVALWAAEASFLICAVGETVIAIIHFFMGQYLPGTAELGIALVSAGVSVFLFYGCRAVSKGILYLTKKAVVGMKTLLMRKENVK